MTPSHIVIHHSLTEDSETVSWGAIRRYHMGELGWKNIGYHYGVELVDRQFEVIMGRPEDQPGAHCKELSMNFRALGICVVGNFDEAPPSSSALGMLRELVGCLQRRYGIPAASVLGHREVGFLAGFDHRKGQYKSCPGLRFDLAELRRSLNA